MTMYHALFPIVNCARLVLVFVFYRKMPGSTFDLRRIDLASELRPFVECPRPARYMDDNELCTTINNRGGLGTLWRAVGEINEEAGRRYLSDPGTKDLRERIVLTGWQLRIWIVFCLAENRWYRMAPNFPRITLRAVTTLYCEMMSTLAAMPSTSENLVLSENNRH